ncbi:hypothetical protein PACTADRAFT_50843 [Pachysolen tannophilus NRRL Y-2460]|uniref:Cytochrome c oxidase assembly protein COX15 n=1 Tax=Pachysolen tannophilus NRRL Y-2460 TaxID=669874 RepID=A0A1E4TTE4_PACTA|nr:hypothetical protein PACTADRAFT_50843 [Pachysolen tannophilus NRRL Y-2460]
MSLSRAEFFFIKNSVVLSCFKKASVRNTNYVPNISAKFFSRLTGNIGIRKYSSTRLESLKWFSFNSFPKRFYSSISTSTSSVLKVKSPSTSSIVKSKWPLNSHKYVGYLCLFNASLVFSIVILGGLTRLTESGLSITEWKPITGSIPPLNEKQWEQEFEKYQESPEFKQLNSHITLDEFKFIFFMEWSHRLLGRTIGMLFVLPSLYFVARRKVSLQVAFKLMGICSLIGFQGFIGWWMVESGLDAEQLAERNSKPTVSQYRLTTHLGLAFIIYSSMIYTGLQVLKEFQIMKNPEKYLVIFKQLNSNKLKFFKKTAIGLAILTFITAMSGGLVAGLDAGLIYNTFPHMGDNYIPSTNELFSPVFSRLKDQSDIWWRNMFENPTTVQLNHRILALTTFFTVFAAHMYSHRIKSLIPRNAYITMQAAMGVAMVQVGLGICTLIWLVPTELAAAHQAGALTLLTTMVILCQQLRKPTMSNMILLKRFLEKNVTDLAKKNNVLK